MTGVESSVIRPSDDHRIGAAALQVGVQGAVDRVDDDHGVRLGGKCPNAGSVFLGGQADVRKVLE